MIPKKIHYCWFGGKEKPKLVKKCMESWKKFCPDYEIIEWNEANFDINTNPYTRMCYQQKKYAFLTDYIRLVVIERYGGIYFDTDVELIKSPDFLLNAEAYVGFETKDYVNTGIGFSSVAHGKMVKAMLAEYDELLDGQNGVIGCPSLNTQALVKLGLEKNGQLQKLPDVTVYPIDWFNPYDAPTGRLNRTKNTISIHWYSASWMKKRVQIRLRLLRPFHLIKQYIKIRSVEGRTRV
ncbi:UNVERIFIED_CONTAM: capsular polysaccharide synthesis protein [Murimonas intestini]|uniref:Capsular polysaccharide synthesis protein n=1 Tax=Murimonas intestini TaxID=1337051 RepID=A0AB73T6F1_9FIRM